MQTVTSTSTNAKTGLLIENVLLLLFLIFGTLGMIYLFKASEIDMQAEIEEHLVSIDPVEDQEVVHWKL
jgi:hypothetical protein